MRPLLTRAMCGAMHALTALVITVAPLATVSAHRAHAQDLGIAIGAITCHFEHGEARGEVSDLIRPPHFHIKHHSELLKACRL